MARWPDGPMARWPDGPMARWPDGPMARWPDGPMARWPDGPMARWPDGPMINSSPLPLPLPAKLFRLFEIKQCQDAAAELGDEVVESFGPIVERRDDGKDHRAGKLRPQHIFQMDTIERRVAHGENEPVALLQANVRRALDKRVGNPGRQSAPGSRSCTESPPCPPRRTNRWRWKRQCRNPGGIRSCGLRAPASAREFARISKCPNRAHRAAASARCRK